MSSIAAGTTSGTALVSTGDTDGTIQLQVNGTTPSVTLAANGSLGVGSSPSYGTNGQVLTSAGTGSAPTWTTVSAGLSAASQAEMETATSNTVAATPSNTQFHPGVAKAWINCSGDGLTINGSYNVSSINDSGTGQLQVVLNTDMSSVNYAVLGFTEEFAGREIVNVETLQAGLFATYCRLPAGGLADPENYFFAAFGDQA